MYGGDLWLAPSGGRRRGGSTNHPGRELFPKFSPDGKWIAFTGEYDGNFNVYVMSAEGGQPRQLTFYQGARPALSVSAWESTNKVATWTPDSRRIVFIFCDSANGWTRVLVGRRALRAGIPRASADERGRSWYLSPTTVPKSHTTKIFRNFRTWKRYNRRVSRKDNHRLPI